MSHTNNQSQDTKKATEEEVPIAQSALITFAVFLLLALMGYFWIYAKHLPSNLPDESRIGIGDWGAFGDFMGGLLNPAVAFAAFYWLTQSVKLQKTELAETRKALEGSEQAQKIQAKNSDRNIRISSRSALIDALQSQISAREGEIRQYETDIEKTIERLAEMNPRVHGYLKRKNNSMSEISGMSSVEVLIMYKTQDLEDLKNHAQNECHKLMLERDMHLSELRKIVEEA